MAMRRLLCTCAASMAAVGMVTAHGGAHQKPLIVDPNADWATRHMAEEHHIGNFDAASFFTLHDFDDNGFWDRSEILKFYGIDVHNEWEEKEVSQERKEEIIEKILGMIDGNRNNVVEKDEWMKFCEDGKTLPDFGLGPGHHWDMETEYEIHHWEKYHDENTKEEDLIHPEDIEHFRKHDELEDEADKQAALDKLAIVDQNIPKKFRRE